MNGLRLHYNVFLRSLYTYRVFRVSGIYHRRGLALLCGAFFNYYFTVVPCTRVGRV